MNGSPATRAYVDSLGKAVADAIIRTVARERKAVQAAFDQRDARIAELEKAVGIQPREFGARLRLKERKA